ncbi:hypothetical protein QP921_03175 [Corynebacterium pseudodiphtheriticum]|uniref:hypothetical protein n=1 Tax=Corynebacterium pseudodiphtheriticum TaxID=37637 RepID=UPI0020BE26D5|nr:hypothetical protein [Corynebacterium pseudodiphtheriticum]MDC7087752.1 hypothetical protein [Corynebacterium pseudodiphtheriticum]MDK4321782.1 hypothetical protein [Corynebacterium pseudodiphtheriticum]MDK8477845.1 hypothetical protein [Corynebacterium pseudodiphtheriticum]MDK8486156.1 hypothetical protein [Corynebacterium pseudodiphtheriticum]MDK8493697.1 hypothetical protein [Corynebacterium pseudodiphtheriticum]
MREDLAWQAIAGFVGFFTVLSGIQAVWNIFQDEPGVVPALLFAGMLVLSFLVWRARP